MSEETKKPATNAIESSTLLEDAAICLDDCLKLMMPEEFTTEQVYFSKRRMFANGGRLARIATTADNLRAASNHRIGGACKVCAPNKPKTSD